MIRARRRELPGLFNRRFKGITQITQIFSLRENDMHIVKSSGKYKYEVFMICILVFCIAENNLCNPRIP